MSLFRSRFVTACQQLLALGVVVAGLAPAAAVVNLDVVHGDDIVEPGVQQRQLPAAALSASQVPTAPVPATVTEYALDAPSTPVAGAHSTGLARRSAAAGTGTPTKVVGVPEEVDGFGTIGVTWSPDQRVDDTTLKVAVRTSSGGRWSGWTTVPYDDDHDPDPGTLEARRATRPGTDALVVGEVDQVQARVVAAAGTAIPNGLSLAVIKPGTPAKTRVERPRLSMSGSATNPSKAGDSGKPGMRLSALATQPTIYSRAQWGADETMRDTTALRYGEIRAAFVHHTVNTNEYTPEQVPAILQSIYAYHVKTRGWSDIGYNFLVDRFGRIWEGRYGGIDKAVVGAHTLGYNEYSFAMSAIGNYQIAAPSPEMIQAFGALFAWKLGMAGVSPTSTSQLVGTKTFAAINGHRDAGKTSCPGDYLYAQIPLIRTLASQAQFSWSNAVVQSNLDGSPYPDIVVRRASDGRGFIVPTGGLTTFAVNRTLAASGYQKSARIFLSPDLTGDGLSDLVVVSGKGVTRVRAGNGAGGFAKPTLGWKETVGHTNLIAVGDANGDGRNDLLGMLNGKQGVIFAPTRSGKVRVIPLDKKFGRYVSLSAAGDLNSDGIVDFLGRDTAGQVWWRQGVQGGFGKARKLAGTWSDYTAVLGGSDFNGDGRPDLVVTQKTGDVWVMHGHGDGTFTPPIGPLRKLQGLSDLSVGQVVDSATPDLLGRKGGALTVVPSAGGYEVALPIDTGADLTGADLIVNAGDWDKDGFGDVITRQADGQLFLRKGDGAGHLAAPIPIATGWSGVVNVAAVGDMTGDGLPDIVGQPPGEGMYIYSGAGAGTIVTRTPIGPAMPSLARVWFGEATPDLTGLDWVLPVSNVRLGTGTSVIGREPATGTLYLLEGGVRRVLTDGMGVYDLAG